MFFLKNKFINKYVLISSIWVLSLFNPISVFAQTPSVFSYGVITQTYPVITQGIKDGDIVSLVNKGPIPFVGFSSKFNDPDLLGVVVTNSNVVFGSSDQSTIPVASSGVVQVWVSDINGSINQDDIVTSSPIPGIGAKNNNSGMILGQAVSSFSAATNISSETVNYQGGNKTVKVGLIRVSLGISNYQISKYEGIFDNVNLFTSSLAGKQVSLLREFLSIIIFLGGVVTFIYGIGVSARHSLDAIGRNPLTKNTVLKYFLSVLSILFVIIIFCFLVSYALLVA